LNKKHDGMQKTCENLSELAADIKTETHKRREQVRFDAMVE